MRRLRPSAVRCLALSLALWGGATGVTSAQPVSAADGLPWPELVSRGLARDSQWRAAREQAEAAEAQWVQARSRLYPRAGVTVTRGQSSDVDLGQPVDRRRERSEATLRWNLFNGLADKSLIEATALERDAARVEAQRARDEAVERLAEAAADVLRLQRVLQRSSQRLDEVQRLSGLVVRQAQAGRGSEADLQLAASGLVNARVAHDTLLADLAAARLKLALLLGEPAGARITPARFDAPRLSADEAARLAEQAPQAGPAHRAAALRAEAARRRPGPVAADYLPKLDLDLRRRLSENTRPLPTTTTQGSWSVGLTYEVPLGGEAGARRDEALHRAAAAAAEAERVALAVQVEAGGVRLRLAQAEEAVPLLQRQVDSLAVVVNASELQYEAGRRSLLQLMDLRDQRFAAEQRQAENDQRVLLSRLRLLSLGGGLGAALGLPPLDGPAAP
ncbi:TolC family protein [Aquabacterium sp. J223]|uniref:TolC family protein n=1 Tax=Aquabacterium sp. J223 TaxID=2898431 RepID=UPI0021AD96AA|nr:TolC family protein [Aquabacterium sp. J223]UUX95084.1 TolC family protein [Aquabacterium sp. J223]